MSIIDKKVISFLSVLLLLFSLSTAVANAAITFSALKDGTGTDLGAITFPAGVTVPLFVTSASFSGGPAIFYP